MAHSTYKWIFRLGMILCGLALVLCIFFYTPPAPPPDEGKTRAQMFGELDFVGIVLFSGGLGTFLMGVIWAGGTYGPKDLHVVVPIVVGLVTLCGFIAWEIKKGDDALVPPHLFKGNLRTFTLPIIVSVESQQGQLGYGADHYHSATLWRGLSSSA